MIPLYLIGALVVYILGLAPNVTGAVNTLFNSDLSGNAVFWFGLLAAFILEVLTKD